MFGDRVVFDDGLFYPIEYGKKSSGKGLGGVSYQVGCQLDKRFDFVPTSIEDHLGVHIMSVVSI